MTTFNSNDKTWTTYADERYDFLPMGSYIGEAVLKKMKNFDEKRVAEYNHDANEAVTMKDIYERTITVALNLKDLKLGSKDIIAFFSRHNSYISSIAFGCYLNGTPWCPFDIIQDNLDYLLEYIKPTIFIYDEEFRPAVEKSLKRLNFKVRELVFGNPSAENSVEKVLLKSCDIKNYVPKDLSKIESADNLIACISFTSGSTGKPKAVPITHSMFVNEINILATLEEFSDENVNMLSPSGIRWIAQLVMMFMPVLFGAKKTFSGRDPDPVNICDVIHKWKVTSILTANSMVHSVLTHYKNTPGYDFTSLRYILSGGEAPCSSMNEKFKKILPNIKIYQGYGMTETGGPMAIQHDLGNINGGHLQKGFSLKVVGENGENVGHNIPGIVHIKGRFSFPGYYKREDANQIAYKDGWLVTGDYGLMTKENHLHIYCRFKDIPKCNGKLIIPNLIEQHLNKHNLVDLCLMIAVPGNSPGDQKIAVFVKLVENVNEKEARTELIKYLKLVVEWDIVAKFSIVDYFKTNSTGKADKEILKREFVI
ncbi:hypothetical protein ACFFRR_001977 [Megaselia abdita]